MRALGPVRVVECLGCGVEIVEAVLFGCEPPALVPPLAVFTAAADIGDRVEPPPTLEPGEPDSRRDGDLAMQQPDLSARRGTTRRDGQARGP
jgi:hypothetical protein